MLSGAALSQKLLPLLRVAYDLGLALLLRLSLGFASSDKGLRLSYGGMAPAEGEKVSGGRVKLRILCSRYRSHHYRANTLYLISSALPKGALVWVRAARARGMRVVLNQNGVAFPAWASPEEISRVNERNRRILEQADLVLFQSRFCEAACERWIARTPAKKEIVYNSVDTNLFCRTRLPESGHLLALGSHAQKERVLLPLQVLALARARGHDWRLTIAGPFHWPGAQAEVLSFVEKHGLQSFVEFPGRYSQADAVRLLNQSAVLLHLQDKDASPTTPLEALACETPVIGLRSGGMPELVDNDCGRLLPVGESWDRYYYPGADALLGAIEEVLPIRDTLGKNGRHRMEEIFSKEKFLQLHEAAFTKHLLR